MTPLTILIAMAAWTAISFWIANAARRGMGQGVSEYFLGGRRMRGFLSGMTYAATTYSAFMLVGLVGLTYGSGVGALGFEMVYLGFTVVFLVIFGPRFWLVGKRYNHITPPELLARRYGNGAVAVTAAFISFIMLIPYSAVQLMGAGYLVNGLTGGRVPYMVGVLIVAALSGFSAWRAGMRSVAWSDAFQGITMLVTALTVLVYVTYRFFGSPAGFFTTIAFEHPELLQLTWTPGRFVGLTLPWAFFALTNPQVVQRMFIPDQASSLRRMVVYFSVFGFIYTVISVLFGYQAAHLVPGLESADQAMPALLAIIPPGLGLIIFLGIYAAATSTLNSILLTLSSLFARDVVRQIRPGIVEKAEVGSGRIALLALLVFSVVFAWFRPGLITVLSSMASGGLLVMAPATIAAFFWKRASAAGALVSMIAGGTLTAFLYAVSLNPLGWGPPVWGLGLTTLLFVVVSLATRPPEGAQEFITGLDQELEKQGFRRRRRNPST